MKRQEIANRAAEKELAEISLEQQVLRELRAKQTQKPGPVELQTTSQASIATSVTDLTTPVTSTTSAIYAKSQPALAVNWASVMEKSEARISGLCSNFDVPVKLCFLHVFSSCEFCETFTVSPRQLSVRYFPLIMAARQRYFRAIVSILFRLFFAA